MDDTIMDLARFLFDRQAKTFAAEQRPDYIQSVWESDQGIRDFWIAEAEAIASFLPPNGDEAIR